MQKRDHIVLNFIDKPLKIFFWTPGQLFITAVPFVIGLVCDCFFLGLVGSFLCAYGMRFFKRKFGKGQLQAVMYWYLPVNAKSKDLPPSHIIEYF
jgi:type IV conjugative transfer system protein TraL